MKIAVAACDLPHPEGTSAGRDLWAWCTALRELGHDVEAWIWIRSPLGPEGPVPEWARYEPLDVGPAWKKRLRALLVARNESSRIGWTPDPDAIAIADHIPSAAAVLGLPRSVVTLHFRALADAWATRRLQTRNIQMARAEHRAARRADLVLTYSPRVGRGLAKPAHFVPMTYPVPAEPVAPVEEPTAALMADWSWPPNLYALKQVLGLWPGVHDQVPGARLMLAGRCLPADAIGNMAGVEIVGEVPSSLDLLQHTSVVVFPCPNSTGPKGKTLEALAHGIPVLTTPAGAEGLVLPPEAGPMVVELPRFAERLIELLRHPEERARLGKIGRNAVAQHHSPMAAAMARVEIFEKTFAV